jgi:hypothetical protein
VRRFPNHVKRHFNDLGPAFAKANQSKISAALPLLAIFKTTPVDFSFVKWANNFHYYGKPIDPIAFSSFSFEFSTISPIQI